MSENVFVDMELSKQLNEESKAATKNTVAVKYDANALTAVITVNGQPFDTSRINGKEIADWAYPFTFRKVSWNGFYDEMVEALGGTKEFDLVFEGSDNALAELKEAWEDAPVTVVSVGSSENIVVIEYDEKQLTTNITVNGQPFDTSRINGKEIVDWVCPFMMRKIKWDGIFEELAAAVGTGDYLIQFYGSKSALQELISECPDNVAIVNKGTENSTSNEGTDTANDVDSEDDKAVLDFFLGDWENADSNVQSDMFSKLLRLAESGNSAAEDTIAVCYQYGKCVEQDDKKAIEWYKKSAEHGDIDGENHLANCYYYGWCTDEDNDKAFHWYQVSAEHGNRFAQSQLGKCYVYEFGTSENPEKAFKWFLKSAEQGNDEGELWCGKCYSNGYGVAEDQYKAVEWFSKAADQGNAEATDLLGLQYEAGSGCEMDIEFAVQCYAKAADSGFADAQFHYANCLHNGEGVAQNDSKAFKYWKMAAEQGNAMAQDNLGLAYEFGWGCTQNYSNAVKWYTKSAEQGNANAQAHLGFCYQVGNGVLKNLSKAVDLYNTAAEQQCSFAYFRLGNCYRYGVGVPVNKEQAKEYFKIGASLGDTDCDESLNEMNKNAGYIDTAKKIGGGILSILGAAASSYAQASQSYYDDDDDY